MAALVRISCEVVERLNSVTKPCNGFIYGITEEDGVSVVAFSLDSLEADDAAIRSELGPALRDHLPGGINVVGSLLVAGENVSEEEALQRIDSITTDWDAPNKMQFRVLRTEEGDCKTIHVYGNGSKLEYDVVGSDEIDINNILCRVKGHLQLLCERTPAGIREAFRYLQERLQAGQAVFRLLNTSHVLMVEGSSDEDISVEEAFSLSWDVIEDDGFGDAKRKKKRHISANDSLNFDLLLRVTGNALTSRSVNCAPIIHCERKPFEGLQFSLPIDSIAVVNRQLLLTYLHDVLLTAVTRQLKASERCLLGEIAGMDTTSVPEPHHFRSSLLGHFITLGYPRGVKEKDLEGVRRAWHNALALPMDRPILRRANHFVFSEDLPTNGPLLNPHVGLPTSDDSMVSLVQGTYSYHHYLQDREDDNGWGCAYRSLQTIVSWFRWQGYTDHPVPSHREIQQCLVNRGDKPANFVGSRQWIGSIEVGYCLDYMLGVTSRIMSVNSGADLTGKGRELATHFRTQGTPIMIGGGVLAHTILGVDFSEMTGDTRFLILDPHYTGGEDLNVIQGKGWCGWKGPEFWDQTAYYNLCMPLRPECI